MLLIVSASFEKSRTLVDVARELSLDLKFLADHSRLPDLMGGKSRRLVLLTEADLVDEVIDCLQRSGQQTPFGLLICGDRESLRTSSKANVVHRFAALDNVEWFSPLYDFDALASAARDSRRRMLRLSREELEAAIDEEQFVLQFQPKVERRDTNEWHACEAEALIRWLHPDRGLLAPVEFLPEVEAYELMPRLTEFVLRKTALQIVKWREQGLGFDVCVNLASSELGRTGLASAYAGIVREHGAECGNFTFEVVEQDLVDPDAAHLDTLKRLRNQGFRICLDNFRVAARSLSTLERLPFDEVKIHASALQRAQDDEVARHVLAAVTGLAHNLGMAVCAEGVEDQETFEFLKTIQCDKLQGFLISEAVLPHIVRRAYSATASRKDEVA